MEVCIMFVAEEKNDDIMNIFFQDLFWLLRLIPNYSAFDRSIERLQALKEATCKANMLLMIRMC